MANICAFTKEKDNYIPFGLHDKSSYIISLFKDCSETQINGYPQREELIKLYWFLRYSWIRENFKYLRGWGLILESWVIWMNPLFDLDVMSASSTGLKNPDL